MQWSFLNILPNFFFSFILFNIIRITIILIINIYLFFICCTVLTSWNFSIYLICFYHAVTFFIFILHFSLTIIFLYFFPIIKNIYTVLIPFFLHITISLSLLILLKANNIFYRFISNFINLRTWLLTCHLCQILTIILTNLRRKI